jgi:hypothetical protein
MTDPGVYGLRTNVLDWDEETPGGIRKFLS